MSSGWETVVLVMIRKHMIPRFLSGSQPTTSPVWDGILKFSRHLRIELKNAVAKRLGIEQHELAVRPLPEVSNNLENPQGSRVPTIDSRQVSRRLSRTAEFRLKKLTAGLKASLWFPTALLRWDTR